MSCLHRVIQYFYLLCATCFVWNSAQNSQGGSNTNLGSSYFFYQQPEYPRDCKEVHDQCSTSSSSGIYLIKPDGYEEPFEVFCNNEADSAGWMVVQRRMDGSISFNRSWEEYKRGFGFLSSEFWLGNEKLSYITNQAAYKLRIDVVLSNGSPFYLEYNFFRITDEWSSYSLASVGEFGGNASSVTTYFTDCYHAYHTGYREDGVYTIRPSGWTDEPFKVLCNMSIDGGGWTVLQRRVNGSVSFVRIWEDYKNGFGILGHEFWLGNDKIHYITNQANYELRMDMVNLDEDAYFAKYSLFRISDEDSKYQLELGVYNSSSTTSYDAMSYHRNQFFSTRNRDNDADSSYHCASFNRVGWWYRNCTEGNLNRPNIGNDTYPAPFWHRLPGSINLMYTDIKIRPV